MSELQPQGSVPEIPLPASRIGDWTVSGALAFTIFVVGVSQAAGIFLLGAVVGITGPLPGATTAFGGSPLAFVAVQIAVQAAQLALAWLLAGRDTAERIDALDLRMARGLRLRHWIGFVALLFVVKSVATIVAAGISSASPRDDLEAFRVLVEDPGVRLAFLFTVVMAGLTEELVFRGVLSRTLETTRLGFWAGAAVASFLFAAVHLQYGIAGQFVVFAIGMTLSWVRARAASLWPAVVCHSVNNALALLALQSSAG